MPLRRVIAFLFVLAAASPAFAAREGGPESGRLVLADRAAAAPRSMPQIRLGAPSAIQRAAWTAFVADAGAHWTATWDRATDVPRRLYGEGISAPGTIDRPDAAAAFARAFLARHIALLAPGSSASDFLLVSNELRRGVRTVGFAQTHTGLRVHSGQVSFRFKSDRLVVIGSEALPNVKIASARASVPAAAASVVATTWLLEDAQAAALESVGEAMILPIVADRVVGYRTVVPVTVSALEPRGKWDVYIDAASGERVGRVQTLTFADGELFYNAPVRQPATERLDFAVPDTLLVVNGLDLLTNADGTITWSGTSPAQVTTKVVGTTAEVLNIAGDPATASFTIAPDGTIVWDERTDELRDAQLTTYVHTLLVKEFARGLAPGLEFLAEQQVANVNIDDSCNAFSDGTTINFFQSSAQCANTGRLPDVVYHEFGHALHSHSIIPGVGFFNGAHSEGLSDYLAATITGDPAMGRGFFLSDAPLRHIDPSDMEHRWPEDVAGPHYTGLIFSGAMWDLRKLLIQKLGDAAGAALADRLFYATLERATDIPSTYVEVLLEDDDDGNLANGTPNGCDINAAFGPHGLRNLQIALSPLANELPDAGGHPIAVTLSGLFEQCPGDQVESVELAWSLSPDDAPTRTFLADGGGGSFSGAFPTIADGATVYYSIGVTLTDLTRLTFPDNPADTLYQFYVGETVELYCTDFETDPFSEGWEHGLETGAAGEGADDWVWGAPSAPPSSGDPPAAFSGTNVLGNDLGIGGQSNGRYSPDIVNFARSPVVDVEQYTDVHLQYRRWLAVEDAFYDRAAIFVNDTLAWQNLNSDMGTSSSIHHQDREWRFQDLPISEFAARKQVQLRFEIKSDQGLEFGGWNIDDLCIVANVNSICGDGNLTGAEDCDNATANSDTAADACRTDCRRARCGDGIVDSSEDCDDGNADSTDQCTNVCTDPPGSGGCCQTGGGNGSGTAALVVLVLALAWRRPSLSRPRVFASRPTVFASRPTVFSVPRAARRRDSR